MLREHGMTHGINSATFKTTRSTKAVDLVLTTAGIANVLGIPEADVIAIVNQMEVAGPGGGATVNEVETLSISGSGLSVQKILRPGHEVPSSID